VPAYAIPRFNENSSVPPTLNDDILLGYSSGSIWHDAVLEKMWVCFSGTVGAAIWREVASIGGSTSVYYNASESEDSRTSTSYAQKVRLTFTAESAAYIIEWSAELKSTDDDATAKVRVRRDDIETLSEVQMSSEDSGWMPFAGLVRLSLSAGSRNIDIDWATGHSGKSVLIRRARLKAYRVS
jgi:hypothetical protein